MCMRTKTNKGACMSICYAKQSFVQKWKTHVLYNNDN